MNIQLALDQNIRREIEEEEASAKRALAEYVAAQHRLMELRAIEHLRVAMGGAITEAKPLALEKAS